MQKDLWLYSSVIYVTVCLGWVSFSEESQDSSQQSYSPHHKGTNLYAKSALCKKINLPLRLLIECLINNFTVFVGMHFNCNISTRRSIYLYSHSVQTVPCCCLEPRLSRGPLSSSLRLLPWTRASKFPLLTLDWGTAMESRLVKCYGGCGAQS